MPKKSFENQPLTIQKLYKICDDEEFSIGEAISMLKENGYKNVPSPIELSSKLCSSRLFEVYGKKNEPNSVTGHHIVTLYKKKSRKHYTEEHS